MVDEEMLIRPYSVADAEAVNAIALAAFAQYNGVFDDVDALTCGVGAMASLADYAELIVAEDETRPVGAVGYMGPGTTPRADFFDPAWGLVRMLVVHPGARGKGIGRKLTDECVARAQRDNAPVLALHTSPVMEVALRMYLKMGFRLSRPLPDRFGVPYALYVMHL